MSAIRIAYDQTEFRVWPDGTVQAVEDGEPYSWMSDDFMLVWAYSEDEARDEARAEAGAA